MRTRARIVTANIQKHLSHTIDWLHKYTEDYIRTLAPVSLTAGLSRQGPIHSGRSAARVRVRAYPGTRVSAWARIRGNRL